MTIRICENCHQEFEQSKKDTGVKRFCNRACWKEFVGLKPKVFECLNCGKEFTVLKLDKTGTRKFCNGSCSASYHNRLNPKRQPQQYHELTCKYCGEKFITENKNATRCPEHVGLRKDGKIIQERKSASQVCGFCGIALKVRKVKFCSAECWNSAKESTFEKSNQFKKFQNGELNDAQVRRSVFIRKIILKSQNGGCALCGQSTTWNEHPLKLVMDHIDGDYTNNFPHNIRLVCPNCDSQLPTFKSRNRGKGRKR